MVTKMEKQDGRSLGGMRGKHHSEESKAKTSASLEGIKRSVETRAKMSLARQNVSEETKNKAREKKLGQKRSPEIVEKMKIAQQLRYQKAEGNPLKDKNISEEHKSAISEGMKKAWAKRLGKI